jgi:hypothetical protein
VPPSWKLSVVPSTNSQDNKRYVTVEEEHVGEFKRQIETVMV